MKTVRIPQSAALMIKWPQSIPASAARDVAKRLQASRTTATWAVGQASQLEALTSWNAGRIPTEAALIVDSAATSAATEQAAAAELSRRLELLRSTGVSVDLVQADTELATGHWPRSLRALGVHGVVMEGGREEASARALPFGVWRFMPAAIVPRIRRWTDWFTRRRPLFAGKLATPAVATIDLGRVGAAGSRAWRELELAIDQTARAQSEGAISVVTMGQLTAQFTQASAPRPQRSILRAA